MNSLPIRGKIKTQCVKRSQGRSRTVAQRWPWTLPGVLRAASTLAALAGGPVLRGGTGVLTKQELTGCKYKNNSIFVFCGLFKSPREEEFVPCSWVKTQAGP